jgi:hypothetical protein
MDNFTLPLLLLLLLLLEPGELSVAMGWMTWSNTQLEQDILLHKVQTSSGVHTASPPEGTGGQCVGVKRLVREAGHTSS